MNLDMMIQLAEKHARTVLIGTKQELLPQWLLLDANGHVEIAGTPWHSNIEKQLVVEAMRSIMRKRQIVAYSLLVEAWFSRLPASEGQGPYTGPPPSERPDRRECVVTMAAHRDGSHRHRHFEIVRDKRGRCTDLQRLDGPQDQITSILFDNLLDQGRAN